jgi:hypothetical protein
MCSAKSAMEARTKASIASFVISDPAGDAAGRQRALGRIKQTHLGEGSRRVLAILAETRSGLSCFREGRKFALELREMRTSVGGLHLPDACP